MIVGSTTRLKIIGLVATQTTASIECRYAVCDIFIVMLSAVIPSTDEST
jgi:hypothetical protein